MGREHGFTLLETMVALSVFMIISAVTIPIGIRLVEWQQLSATADLLSNRLRLAQSESIRSGKSTMIEFSPYQPVYALRTVSNIRETYRFPPGVIYKDGYLQLNTNRIAYGVTGNSEVSGTIRIASRQDELNVMLYMGGLCERVGALP